MKKEYHFKSFYKIMSLISVLIMLVATALNAYLGEPIAIILLLALVITFLQYRRHASPYIEIEKDLLKIRFTWVRTFALNVAEIIKVEQHPKQIVLHLASGKQMDLHLGYLKGEDKERVLVDIPALVKDLK